MGNHNEETLDPEADGEEEAAEAERLIEHAAVTNTRSSDDLYTYMQCFRKYPTLKDHKLTLELFSVFNDENGKPSERARARDLLVYGNMRLVLKHAIGFGRRGGMSFEDFMQEGTIGLMTAIKKFESEKGFHFSTYATHWIRQAMTRALHDKGERDPYRVPVHRRELESLVVKTQMKLYLKLGRLAREIEVYQAIKAVDIETSRNASLATITEIMRDKARKGNVPLNAPLQRDGNEGTMGDVIGEQPKTETIVEARRLYGEYKEALNRIEMAINSLKPRTATVLCLRFGLGEFEMMTLEEIGERYELTRERVRQIEEVGLTELQNKLGITTHEIEKIIETTLDLEVLAHAV